MKVKVRLSRYDWIVINTSGGKDSQTTMREVVLRCLAEGVPLSRVVAVHADLGEAEWEGTGDLARRQAEFYGLRFLVVKREKCGLLEEVVARRAILDAKGKFDQPAWPSSTERYCTSYYKRDQVKKVFTVLTDELRNQGVKRRVRILNCMGMRAAESAARSKLLPFGLNDYNGRRIVHDWLPIFTWSEQEVWSDIRESGVEYSPVYDLGMPRLSCVFCIFAPKNALLLAGKHNLPLLRKYVEVEKQVRSTFRKNLALADVLAEVEAGVEPGKVRTWEM